MNLTTCAHEDQDERFDGDTGYGWHIYCNECDLHFTLDMELI